MERPDNIKDFVLTGIRRAGSDSTCEIGSCNEIIGMEYKEGRVVPFEPVPSDVSWRFRFGGNEILPDNGWVHKTTNQTNYIFSKDNNIYWIEKEYAESGGTELNYLANIGDVNKIDIVGNVIVVGSTDKAYLFYDGKYSLFNRDDVTLKMQLSATRLGAVAMVGHARTQDSNFKNTLDTQYMKLNSLVKEAGFFYGIAFMRYAIKLYDGSYILASSPVLVADSKISDIFDENYAEGFKWGAGGGTLETASSLFAYMPAIDGSIDALNEYEKAGYLTGMSQQYSGNDAGGYYHFFDMSGFSNIYEYSTETDPKAQAVWKNSDSESYTNYLNILYRTPCRSGFLIEVERTFGVTTYKGKLTDFGLGVYDDYVYQGDEPVKRKAYFMPPVFGVAIDENTGTEERLEYRGCAIGRVLCNPAFTVINSIPSGLENFIISVDIFSTPFVDWQVASNINTNSVLDRDKDIQYYSLTAAKKPTNDIINELELALRTFYKIYSIPYDEIKGKSSGYTYVMHNDRSVIANLTLQETLQESQAEIMKYGISKVYNGRLHIADIKDTFPYNLYGSDSCNLYDTYDEELYGYGFDGAITLYDINDKSVTGGSTPTELPAGNLNMQWLQCVPKTGYSDVDNNSAGTTSDLKEVFDTVDSLYGEGSWRKLNFQLLKIEKGVDSVYLYDSFFPVEGATITHTYIIVTTIKTSNGIRTVYTSYEPIDYRFAPVNKKWLFFPSTEAVNVRVYLRRKFVSGDMTVVCFSQIGYSENMEEGDSIFSEFKSPESLRNNVSDYQCINRWYYADVTIENFLEQQGYDLGVSNEIKENGNVFKVSEVNNPLVFPFKNTYQVGNGDILGFASNSVALSQGQFGVHPLYVFTTEGIYSMTVDTTGNAVYLNCVPVSREVCSNPSTITEVDGGVVFASKKGLMVISGSNIKNLSEQITGRVGMLPSDTEESFSANKIYKNAINHPFLVQLSNSISMIGFKEYLNDAGTKLSYLYEKNSLLVYNYMYDYCYMIELGTLFCTKLAKKIKFDNKDYPSSLYAVDNYLYQMVKFDYDGLNTFNQTMFQTRPIVINRNTFSSKYRVAVRGRIIINGENISEGKEKYAGLYVFGSNDCSKWMYLGGTEVKGEAGSNKEIRDIGTTVSHVSCKYLSVVFVGELNYKSEIDGVSLSEDIKYNQKIR